ncbi:hypothetical protein [Brevundimonas sp. 'scallop']|uniref:hypothetical protein n=1 Tax=Brevundimonas sp. 'scallop' TaxID=2562582 RepID=UPI0013E138C8|nr:hypothetical protein [Brevundimonas sp. 'scallop']QIF81893.1 hypothetical protein E4341_09385 [Brevundimonas sp. 'scallop']
MTDHIGEATQKVIDLDALEKLADEAEAPPARRINIRTGPTSVASFTAPGHLSDAEAAAEFRKFQQRTITGHTRRIVCIDGPPRQKYRINSEPGLPIFTKIKTPGLTAKRIVWALKVARSYVDSWINRLALKTIRRGEVNAKLAELDAGISGFLARNGKGEGK